MRREDAAKPKGGNEIAVAAFVLGICAMFAVGMFFLARYLTASGADAPPSELLEIGVTSAWTVGARQRTQQQAEQVALRARAQDLRVAR